ncbi:alpha/beta fold hydrolase [Micromonospora zamorensis]|uniref:alpha/beta fold hydrolase n=1 Tax=Micromonospora zamorensis TaxID=709883 RepID=UPI003CEC7BE5
MTRIDDGRRDMPATRRGIRTLTPLKADSGPSEPMPTTTHTLAATIPAARHVVWPGQSHFATMTAPALVADTLRQFFAGISAT